MGVIIYWTSSNMFDQIYRASISNNIKMTVYVDYITFSGKSIKETFFNSVLDIIKSCGYVIKDDKIKKFPPKSVKKNYRMYYKSK
jgi:hypothetical protein